MFSFVFFYLAVSCFFMLMKESVVVTFLYKFFVCRLSVMILMIMSFFQLIKSAAYFVFCCE